ncbi:MBL fold metallo-hydrolase [Enterovirga sp. CN4-39]|uniref:MBL fold metallo-hydrolase n=1 Tax=Enterovirga sp. CN4-39 TaxID=3400910 RepID=UPI003C06FFFF
MTSLAAGLSALQVRFWGVRGSVPACGPRFERYGGNTPCVEIRCNDRLVVVDAGTGLVALGVELGPDAPATIDILLSHLHLDHVGGLPFFRPALMADRFVRLHCGNLRGETAEVALDRLFSPPLFPVSLAQLPGSFEHVGFKAGDPLRLDDGLEVRTIPLNHPGGATGYRFDHGGRAICYISDIEHEEPWPPPDLASFVAGSDLVIYDGMFSETEYLRCRGWGHSTWEKGVALCEAAGVTSLAIFHLHPQHDDEYLARLDAEMGARMPGAFLAREGQILTYPADD